MPPHLHPRSTATSTLFAGTLLASFVVVAIPHLVPCPRSRGRGQLNTEMTFDEQGKPTKRGRTTTATATATATKLSTPEAEVLRNPLRKEHSMQFPKGLESEAAMFKQLQQEAEVLQAESQDRECPVPKPKGVLGKWLGFQEGRKVEAGKD